MAGAMTVPAFAHTTITVDQYAIEVGWGVEPPIVGLRNTVVTSVMELGEREGISTGVTHVFRGVDAKIFSGGESKLLAFNSDPKPGHYYSPIIPTQTGTYLVEIKGDIRGTPVDVRIPIEDVEHTAILDFPPVMGGGSSGDGSSGVDAGSIDSAEVAALKKAVISLQQDISKIESGRINIPSPSDGSGDGGGDNYTAYNLAILGLSISAAAVVLGVVALVRKPSIV